MKKFIAFIILLFSINAFAQLAPSIGTLITKNLLTDFSLVKIEANQENYLAIMLANDMSAYSIRKVIQEKIVYAHSGVLIVEQSWEKALNDPNTMFLSLSINEIDTHLITIAYTLDGNNGYIEIAVSRYYSLNNQ